MDHLRGVRVQDPAALNMSAKATSTDYVGSRSPEVDTERVTRSPCSGSAELRGMRGRHADEDESRVHRGGACGQGGTRGITNDLSGSVEPAPPAEIRTDRTQPFVVDLPDPNIRCGLCGVQVGTVMRAARHFAARHGKVPIMYKCRRCGRTSPNCHPIACHIPKCQGVVGGGDNTRGFSCECCEASFVTKRGLSAHRWRVHDKASETRSATARSVTKRGTATKRTAEEGMALSDSEDWAGETRRCRVPVSAPDLPHRHKRSPSKRRKVDSMAKDPRDERNATPMEQVRPRPPILGLLEYFREQAGDMTGTSELIGDEHTLAIKMWLEKADNWSEVLESAA